MSRDRNGIPELRRLREQVAPFELVEVAQARRRRLVPAIERAMREANEHTRRVRVRRHRTWMASSFAAVFLVGVALWFGARPHGIAKGGAEIHIATGTAGFLHEGRESVLRAGGVASATFVEGDIVATAPASNVALDLASGASVALGPLGRLGLELSSPEAEVIRLEEGTIDVHVPKLGRSRRLAVRTNDALVTVHGTVFSVSIGDERALGAAAKVAVTEGLVSVQCAGESEVFLGPGESHTCSDSLASPSPSWTAVPTPPLPPLADEPADHALGLTTGSAPREDRDGPPAARERSIPGAGSLAAENRLFGDAMAASRAGDDRRAVSVLQRFLDSYPASPLVQEVCVEHFRSLARLGDRAGASHSAARYLMAFHNGFARDEARRLIIGAGAATPAD